MTADASHGRGEKVTSHKFILDALERPVCVENNSNEVQYKTILPGTSFILSFQYGNVTVREVTDQQQLLLPVAAVHGPRTMSKQYLMPPGSKILICRLRPGSAQFFLDVKPGELTDKNIPLHRLTNGDLLPAAFTDKTAFVVQLLTHLFRQHIVDQTVADSIALIEETGGKIRVEALAALTFSCRRTLERKFKQVTGLTLKKYAGIVRFQHTIAHLQNEKNIAGASYECGYSDPSHLVHACKTVTGFTPGILIRQLCRIFPMKSVFLKSPLHHQLLLQNQQ